MRIQMLINVTDRNGSYKRGEVRDLSEAKALALISRGRALPLDRTELGEAEGLPAGPVSMETEGRAELETAALAEPPETTAEPKPRRKKKGD